jgi:hypothetical protein
VERKIPIYQERSLEDEVFAQVVHLLLMISDTSKYVAGTIEHELMTTSVNERRKYHDHI